MIQSKNITILPEFDYLGISGDYYYFLSGVSYRIELVLSNPDQGDEFDNSKDATNAISAPAGNEMVNDNIILRSLRGLSEAGITIYVQKHLVKLSLKLNNKTKKIILPLDILYIQIGELRHELKPQIRKIVVNNEYGMPIVKITIDMSEAVEYLNQMLVSLRR